MPLTSMFLLHKRTVHSAEETSLIDSLKNVEWSATAVTGTRAVFRAPE